MDYKNLLYSKEGNIAVIQLNRPKVMNTLNLELVTELYKLLDEVALDKEV
ncbi:enoyl-CoA hydratase-related protein [Desulfoscipio gibsoniae]|uniref:Enoyl-CoA hydratase/carnithine racemase n=1 Tax=Desulfoscipio gibsoniae DSM 7213 TaxID=767817 RepID=R4KL21_9FIRM|nr:enoyl-CoA hydratase-related protein [Desulfoscipio gibsoniae]AGL03898.1 enoyl-CoA hydratase/carnithine racemase [Desulfoscipio gibsoniae DSM 7213]